MRGIEPEEVESIKRFAQAPISLEKPVGDEEQFEFGQLIVDEHAESPYERALETVTKDALRNALENLSYRERRVLELRYGLGGEHPRTHDESGARSTSRASDSASSNTIRSRSFRTSPKLKSCATTSRSLPDLRSPGSAPNLDARRVEPGSARRRCNGTSAGTCIPPARACASE